MRALEVAQFDFCGFVILVGVDFECISLVLLDLGLRDVEKGLVSLMQR